MKSILIVFISFLSLSINAQINIGPAEKVTPHQKDFEKGDLDLLKATKTLFIYRTGDEDNLDEFKEIIRPVWNITELEFISWEEYKENTYDESYSYITLGGLSNSSGNVYFFLSLWLEHNDQKKTYFRIDLFPSFETFDKIMDYTGDGTFKALDYMYSDADFRNWNLGFLKNYLQYANNSLKENKNRWLFKNETDPEIKDMKDYILYIPEYIFIAMAKFTGDESKQLDRQKIMKDYKYRYKIVSRKKLSEMITESEHPVHYLIYVKSSTDKFITIINSETGKIVYAKYKALSYNVKSKDFKEIMKAINTNIPSD